MQISGSYGRVTSPRVAEGYRVKMMCIRWSIVTTERKGTKDGRVDSIRTSHGGLLDRIKVGMVLGLFRREPLLVVIAEQLV